MELHEQHINSLRSRKFSAAHETVNGIHELLRYQDYQLSEPNPSVSYKRRSGCEKKDLKVALYPGPRPANVQSSSTLVDWSGGDREDGRKCLNRMTKDLEDTTSTMKD